MKDEGGRMKSIAERVIERAIEIQQIPAPTFGESRRAEFVRDTFVAEGLKDVSMDEAGNVFACLAGSGGRKPLIVSAHLDTVFPADTDLRITRGSESIRGPGLGDNSLGIAALSGLAWLMRTRGIEPAGDLWLVANVGEEGLGNLRGMKAVVDRFGANALVYLVVEGLALGHIYHRAVGVRRYRIRARTSGGHPWSDHGKPSAVHELSRLVVAFLSIDLPRAPRTTLNVGRIAGGTAVNVIAPEAELELDLRSEGRQALAALASEAEGLIQAANKPEVRFEAGVIGERPTGEIDPDHPLVELAQECLREQGLEAALTSGSTDANLPLSKGYPALVLGITTGGGAHTMHEFINLAPVARGMEQLGSFVERAWDKQ